MSAVLAGVPAANLGPGICESGWKKRLKIKSVTRQIVNWLIPISTMSADVSLGVLTDTNQNRNTS